MSLGYGYAQGVSRNEKLGTSAMGGQVRSCEVALGLNCMKHTSVASHSPVDGM